MSIFWLGGEEKIVPNDEIRQEMCEDRYFLPGIIHGGDYLINIYLNDSMSGEEDDPMQFEINYFTRELILAAHELDPLHGETFEQTLLCRCESFGCRNDGKGGFAELVECWPQSIAMRNSDIVEWAK